MKNSVTSSRLDSTKCSRDASFTSSIGSGSGPGSVLVWIECEKCKGTLMVLPRQTSSFPMCLL
jgi:hypothetical protein